MSLMVIVAIKDWIIDQLNLLILSNIIFLLLFLSIFFFPHGRRVWSFPFAHVFIHQPVSEPVIRLLADLLKVFGGTSSV